MRIGIHIFKHEIRKIIADKKLLISMFIMPIILVFLTSFFSVATNSIPEDSLPQIYALNDAFSYNSADLKIIPVEYNSLTELQENISLKDSDIVIEINNDGIIIYCNEADITSYNIAIACEQLFYDNIACQYSNPVRINNISTIDLNDSMDMRNAFIATLLPYMLVLFLFQNTSNFAIDTIAGEKERGVFGKTLLAPVNPAPVIIGKILASATCGLVSCFFYFGVVCISELITGYDAFGLKNANLTAEMIIYMSLSAIILCYFVATLIVLHSLKAKTVKDAQNSSRLAFILVSIAAIASMFRTGTLPLSHYLIPVYNICIVMQDILYSSVNGWKVLSMIGSLIGCSLIVSGLTVLIFKKESVNY